MNKERIMGIFPFMFLLFLTLKLTDLIDWSWFAVCSPLIAIVAFYALAFIIGMVLTIRFKGKYL